MINAPKDGAVALVSGGLDSVVSLAAADRELDVRLVLFCDYGQRARESERASVLGVVNYYGLPFREVSLRWLRDLAPAGMRGPAEGETEVDETAPLDGNEDVWVPNRNGVFINVAAAFAESYDCSHVVTGFNREEAEEFPDNTGAYVDAVNRALLFSTRNGVKVVSFTLDLTKREILRKGIEVGAPLSVIWSCYRSGERMCGKCPSCRKLMLAIDALPADDRPVIEFER